MAPGKSLGLALGIALGTSQALAAGPAIKRAKIELPPALQVAPGQLTLGRVARITTNDLTLLKQLMRMSVGAAPGLGGAMTVQQKQLVQMAEHVRGQENVVLEWAGAPATQISVKGQRIMSGELVREARAALSGWLQLRTVRSQLELALAPPDAMVPTGELELRVRPISAGSAFARRTTVWTEIWCNGQFYQAVPTTFEVHADGIVAQQPAATFTDAPAPAMPRVQVAAQEAPHAAAPAMTTAASPQPRLEVRRGQPALLQSSDGPITVQATVQVLQDGTAGQRVQVKSASRNEVFYARVIGPGQLEAVR